MRQFGLLLTVALFGLAGCSGDSVGITNPMQIEQDLVGSWVQVDTVPGAGTNFTLAVSDSVVTGTGHWSGEAIPGGNIVVTGFVTGQTIVLELAEDNGTTLHYQAQMLAANLLSGQFIGDGTRTAGTYQRQDPPQ